MGLVNRQGQISAKQQGIFEEVMELLQGVKVRRHYNKAEVVRSSEKALISTKEEYYKGLSHSPEALGLELDELFEPSKDNPIRLGAHLSLIPGELFQESPNSHNLVTPLASYLTGSWLLNYGRDKGCIRQTAEEIISGCALRITSRAKSNMVAKLNSELAYMAQKGYIGELNQSPSPEGNNWRDSFEITAPKPLLGFFQSGFQAALPS